MTPITHFQVTEADKILLKKTIQSFQGKKVLILGDIGVDEYILGEVRRISPEAPVPVLEVESEDTRLGLAANVAQNIVSLGGQALLLSVVGQDTGAELLKNLLQKNKVSTEHLVVDTSRPTTRKARVMAKHHHLVRVDYEVKHDISNEVENKILAQAQNLIPTADVVIIEDYAKGFITENLVKKVSELAHKNGKKVFVDPHRTHKAEFYTGVDLFKPNFDESLELAQISYDDYRKNPAETILKVGQMLKSKTQAENIVMTQGKEGMTIFSQDQIVKVPTYARQVFDVTGAGDTVIAALALGLCAGLSLTHAASLANFAAGVVVGQIGCVPCTQKELIDYIG